MGECIEKRTNTIGTIVKQKHVNYGIKKSFGKKPFTSYTVYVHIDYIGYDVGSQLSILM